MKITELSQRRDGLQQEQQKTNDEPRSNAGRFRRNPHAVNYLGEHAGVSSYERPMASTVVQHQTWRGAHGLPNHRTRGTQLKSPSADGRLPNDERGLKNVDKKI